MLVQRHRQAPRDERWVQILYRPASGQLSLHVPHEHERQQDSDQDGNHNAVQRHSATARPMIPGPSVRIRIENLANTPMPSPATSNSTLM